MAASKRPSFLKRQKEQQRLQRAAQKRETRLTRKHNRGTEIDPSDLPETAEEAAADDPTLEAAGTADPVESETVRGETTESEPPSA
ncbi:MAG: hypothetical protein ABI960_03960 [Candidatus Eisenbacteria bacterium]